MTMNGREMRIGLTMLGLGVALLAVPTADVLLSAYPRPQQLAEFVLKAHLPTMHAFRFFEDAGGRMSYGAT
jgi:hypothetical protein